MLGNDDPRWFLYIRTLLRLVRTAMTLGVNSPVRPSRLVSKRLVFSAKLLSTAMLIKDIEDKHANNINPLNPSLITSPLLEQEI